MVLLLIKRDKHYSITTYLSVEQQHFYITTQ